MSTSPLTLESILLPNTPAWIKEQYMSLAKRAKSCDFGPLEEDFVVLDTETTGLSFRDCELIEIAAARISGQEIVERYQSFVKPKKPIPAEIQQLTGIHAINVQDAPRARAAVAGLANFVAGSPVIAHNAAFDRGFIERVTGGSQVSDIWIDSLALSRIALPRLSTHRLADMAQAFGCDSVTHRAMDDVDALCGMWRIMLLGLSDLPAGLLAELASMHEDIAWSYRPLFSYLSQGAESNGQWLADIRTRLVAAEQKCQRSDANELVGPLDVPTKEEIEQCFSSAGTVAELYESFESRPSQLQMAQEIRDALESSTHRTIEAGTGIGKTLAYLIPEILFAKANGVTVGIATKTNTLTDQLISHDLPALAEALPGGVSYVVLKGYEHYPCLNRLQAAMRTELPQPLQGKTRRSHAAMQEDMLSALAVVAAYASQSVDGDIDLLGIRWGVVPRSMLTTTATECKRYKCPFRQHGCILHGARERAASSDVVITNHSLLLRNVAMDGSILPPIRHWVIDEAHSLESEARRQWALEVSAEAVAQGFERLGGTKTGVIGSMFGQVEKLDGQRLYERLLTKLAASATRARTGVEDFLEAVHGLIALAPGGNYDNVSLWIDESVRQTPAWEALTQVALACEKRLDEAHKDVQDLALSLAGEHAQLAGELREAGRFIHELLATISLIVSGEDQAFVYAAQLSRKMRERGQERLTAERIDIGSELGARWLSEMDSVIFTSATVAVGSSFEHFEQAVGLGLSGTAQHRNIQLASSFDYDANMSSIVVRDMPNPNSPEYSHALEDLLFDIHQSMGGSVLTLFTNRREMERVYEGLAPRLAAIGLQLDMQERGSSPRRLREAFINDKSRSLLALKSFWEGFDAAGETLRCVVIAKLPFANPHDPLAEERKRRDAQSWRKYSLPEAVLEVKQAAGRLIRSERDTGVLVIADSRVANMSYGRAFVQSLPTSSATELNREHVGRYISMWREARR